MKKMISLPASPSRRHFPLLGTVVKQQTGFVACERLFSLKTDRYLIHHKFDNIPLLPGVIGLELFAELARFVLPKEMITDFVNVEFRSAVKFKHDTPCLVRSSLQYTHTKGNASLEQINPTGASLCFRAELLFASHKRSPPPPPQFNFNSQKEPLFSKEFIYRVLPHGPLMQPLTAIKQLSKTTVLAVGNFSRRRLFSWHVPTLALQPLAIEAAFQAIGLMDFIATGKAGLPSKIGRLTFFKASGKPRWVLGEKIAEKTFNFVVLTEDAEVLLQATNYQTVNFPMRGAISVLERVRSHILRKQFVVPKNSWLEVVSLRLLRDKLSRESAFLETFLRPSELNVIKKLPPKKQFLAIAEQYALKRALRVIFFEPSLLTFEIQTDANKNRFCQYKRKRIYLTIKVLENYVLVLASYRKPCEITPREE